MPRACPNAHTRTVNMLAGLGFLALAPSVATRADDIVELGQLSRFWRNRPVLGRWLKGRLGLTAVPQYLRDPTLSFPYRRRPYAEELLFADHLTVVRLLGGWKTAKGKGELDGAPEADLATRGPDGGIHYRWELLAPRLDHYVRNGYGLTIVLDNTPWCFPAEPDEGSHFGQSAPPAEFAEWQRFVGELCRRLVGLYGFETVNTWRFRMGTECQGTARFGGTQEQFHQLYDHAAAAVKSVLPGAAFGPFNLAGAPDGPNISYHDLADHCVRGTNHATGRAGSPLDFACVSLYTAPSIMKGILRTTDPAFKASQKTAFWDELTGRHPQLKGISREVHEFGVLGNEFGFGHGEPGARGAAWRFCVMVDLLAGGLDRLWHWGVTENVNLGQRRQVLQSSGWLLSVLEHAAGGEAYLLPVEAEPLPADDPAAPGGSLLESITAYERPVPLTRPGRGFLRCLAVVKDRRLFLITAAYNEDRFATDPTRVTVHVPEAVFGLDGDPKASCVELTRTNALYFRIRRDLDDAGLLTDGFKAVPGLLSPVKTMNGRPAWRHVDEHWPRYEQIIRDSLTLGPFAGTVDNDGRGLRVSFGMRPPQVTAVVVE